MTEIERKGVLRFWTDHDITIEGFTDWPTPKATIKAYHYPDGSPKNSLTADELREVANALEAMAKELEGADDGQ